MFTGTRCSCYQCTDGIILVSALASYARGLMSPSYPSLYKRTFQNSRRFWKLLPINYSVNNIGALLSNVLVPNASACCWFPRWFPSSAVLGAALLSWSLFAKALLKPVLKSIQQPVALRTGRHSLVFLQQWLKLVFFMFSNMDIGQNIVYAIGGAAIVWHCFFDAEVEKSDMLKMGTILIITFLTTCFFVYYGQMMKHPMTMVAINTMRGDLFRLHPCSTWSINGNEPTVVYGCLAPIIAGIFSNLEKKNINFSTATKVGFSFILTYRFRYPYNGRNHSWVMTF